MWSLVKYSRERRGWNRDMTPIICACAAAKYQSSIVDWIIKSNDMNLHHTNRQEK